MRAFKWGWATLFSFVEVIYLGVSNVYLLNILIEIFNMVFDDNDFIFTSFIIFN